MKAYISANSDKCSYEDFSEVLDILNYQKIEVTGTAFDGSLSKISSGVLESEADFIVVMGGDGSIIRAVQESKGKIPVVGINFGKLGYLANFSMESFKKNISHICSVVKDLNSPDDISNRTLLQVDIGGSKYMAVNDFVLDIGPPFRTMSYSVYINGSFLSDVRGDGIIISTPTGSTAYNMSAGGSILQPEMEGFTITPKNPNRLSIRPIVVRDDQKITLRVKPHDGAWAIVDGQMQIDLSSQQDVEIHISRHDETMKLINNPEIGYWNTLRSKLNWGT